MTSLSESARQHLEQYIHQVRMYLTGCEGVDPEQVERDVRDHIDRDLQTEDAPVSEEALSGILRRLGAPWQWIPRGDQPWWRRLLISLRSGPDDYRLAYISLGLLLLGFIVPHLLPVALVGSFLAARAVLAFNPTPTEIQQKRWLIYPSLAAVYLLVLGIFLMWPAGLVGSLSGSFEQTGIKNLRGTRFDSDTIYWVLVWLTGAAFTGIWWIVGGGLLMMFASIRRSLFRPFLEGPRLPRTVIAIGLSVAIVCGAGAAILYHRAIGG